MDPHQALSGAQVTQLVGVAQRVDDRLEEILDRGSGGLVVRAVLVEPGLVVVALELA